MENAFFITFDISYKPYIRNVLTALCQFLSIQHRIHNLCKLLTKQMACKGCVGGGVNCLKLV